MVNTIDEIESFKDIETKRKLTGSIRKAQLPFLEYIMTKDSLENLALTRYIEIQRDRGKRQVTSLMNFMND